MLMAWLGQVSTHAPQSPHVAASMTARLSLISIAPSGHDSTHSSQPVHFSGFTEVAMKGLPEPYKFFRHENNVQ
jgi:hypothetical protein